MVEEAKNPFQWIIHMLTKGLYSSSRSGAKSRVMPKTMQSKKQWMPQANEPCHMLQKQTKEDFFSKTYTAEVWKTSQFFFVCCTDSLFTHAHHAHARRAWIRPDPWHMNWEMEEASDPTGLQEGHNFGRSGQSRPPHPYLAGWLERSLELFFGKFLEWLHFTCTANLFKFVFIHPLSHHQKLLQTYKQVVLDWIRILTILFYM